MSKFDNHVRKEIQTYLSQHVKINSQDLTNIHKGIVKRKKSINLVYISAFSLLLIVISISTFSFIQPNPDLDSRPLPYSSKQSEEKEVPTINQEEELPEATEPKEAVEYEEKEEEQNEVDSSKTEAEREVIFMELLEWYNKLEDIEFDYDGNKTVRDEYGNLGHKLKDFHSLEEFLAQFSDFATLAATEKMHGLFFEHENGLYVIEGEHQLYDFQQDHPYQLEKISESQYYLNQTYGDNIFRYSIFFEFSKINNKWLITDWRSSWEEIENGPPLLPEIDYLMTQFLVMELSVEYNWDKIDYLKDGREAHRVLNASSKNEFYSLFEDFTTLEILQYIWEDYLVEENGELFLLDARNYYPGFFDTFEYQYTKVDDGVYEITQTYFLESDNSTYDVYFKIEFVNNSTWKVTDYYFSKE